ncbi:T9SS type A sorting domain-containing protein [Mariniflexile aquimaris]|uniref:T9SS type A sorting domain-containing protein n=1 Tax=Mariniflexile aquimaris TaxID=881009 RepID=A0ABW3BQX9_9FLAO
MNIFKHILPLLFFSGAFLLCANGNAQKNLEACGTVTNSETLYYLNSIKPELKKFEQAFLQLKSVANKSQAKFINSIPVKAHVIRSSDGTGGICESDLYNAFSNLNTVYADAFMSFFLCEGINYINEDELCHLNKGDETNLIERYNVPGLINIYFTDDILGESDDTLCGYTDNSGRNDVIVLKNSCVTNSSSLAHEMGHFFSLIHTHGPDNTKLTTEFVDGSNCDTDGDGICDTPADPKLTSKNVNNFCEYTGTEKDAHGDLFAPDAQNIMSYSLKGCRSHFSNQQLARMYAFYHTAKSYLACPDFSANFTADVTQTCEDELIVNFNSNCKNISNWAWDVDSDGVIDYTSKNPSHTFKTGIYDVTLTVSNKSQSITKTYSNFINVGTESNWLQEDFDSFTTTNDKGWTATDVTQNGYNWLKYAGATPSDNTGPLADSSSKSGSGNYIYAEATGAKPGDVAEFISPCITINYENSVIEFAYHMYGKSIGELHVDLKTDYGYINDVIPALIGSQQNQQSDAFLTKDIDVSAFTNQTINIRFRAIRGFGWDGDIAIDNIFIKTIITPITDKNTIAYPNPVKDNLLYVKTDLGLEPVQYQIANLTGSVFMSGVLTNQPINIANLSSGMYLLTVSNSRSSITKKIIK